MIHKFYMLKDPRRLKVVDLAVGSGHFLLYSFDLLQTIYEEAERDYVAFWERLARERARQLVIGGGILAALLAGDRDAAAAAVASATAALSNEAVARILAAVAPTLRCRPALRSCDSSRAWESRRPGSGLGAAANTASASRPARSAPKSS